MKKPVVLLLVLAALVSGCQKSRYIQVSGYAQGGTYTVKANLAGTRIGPEALRDSVDALLRQIDTTLSGYNKNGKWPVSFAASFAFCPLYA